MQTSLLAGQRAAQPTNALTTFSSICVAALTGGLGCLSSGCTTTLPKMTRASLESNARVHQALQETRTPEELYKAAMLEIELWENSRDLFDTTPEQWAKLTAARNAELEKAVREKLFSFPEVRSKLEALGVPMEKAMHNSQLGIVGGFQGHLFIVGLSKNYVSLGGGRFHDGFYTFEIGPGLFAGGSLGFFIFWDSLDHTHFGINLQGASPIGLHGRVTTAGAFIGIDVGLGGVLSFTILSDEWFLNH